MAQFNLSWSNSYAYTVSSGFSNEVRKVATDSNGNIFVLSDVTSDIDSANHPGPTQYYVLLQKYSPAGLLLVQKHFNVRNMHVAGTFNYSSAFALVIDAGNNVFIGFNRYNAAGTNSDVQIMKYNNALTSAWTFAYTSPADDSGIDIVLRGSATFFLFKSVSGANTTYSIAKAMPNTSTSVPLYSFDPNLDVINSVTTTPTLNLFFTGYRLVGGVKVVLTASVNSGGLLKWKSTFNNSSASGDDYGTKIIVGNDGFLYIVGTVYSNATYGSDAIVMRYNASTGLMNAKLPFHYNFGTNINDFGYEIVEGASGVKFLGAVHGNSHVLVYKFTTTNGLVLNGTGFYIPNPPSFTTISAINISDMKVSNSGKVYLSGGLTGNSSSGTFSASYLANFGNSGGVFSFLSNTPVIGTSDDSYQGVCLALDPPRNVIVSVQNLWSTNSTHNNELILIDSYSMGILRIGNDSNFESREPLFYPNPASETLHVKNSNFDLVSIYDLAGKLIKTFEKGSTEFDISAITPGQYILQFISSSGIKTEKLIVN